MEKPDDAPVEVFRGGEKPTRPYVELAVVQEAFRESAPEKGINELVKDTRKMGGDAVIIGTPTSSAVMGGLQRNMMPGTVIAWK